MKTSRLLTSVLHEPWMMMPDAVESYLPIVAKWLNGIDLTFEERAPLSLQMAYAGRINPGYPEDIADFPDGSVAIVNLKGELTKYDGMCNYGAASIGNLIKTLGASKNIAGIVLDTDGPGGSVNAIAPMIEAIQFAQAQGKPVVVHGDLVASAHYYVAIHSDYFMIDNTIGSRVGSIGVLIQFADYKEYFEKQGIKLRTVYAPESTHKNLEFEKMQEGDDEPMKQLVLSPLAKKFQQAVREQRAGKLDESAEGILNGAMFFGEDAVRFGLVDSVGTLGDAVQRALDLNEVRRYMSFSR